MSTMIRTTVTTSDHSTKTILMTCLLLRGKRGGERGGEGEGERGDNLSMFVLDMWSIIIVIFSFFLHF